MPGPGPSACFFSRSISATGYLDGAGRSIPCGCAWAIRGWATTVPASASGCYHDASGTLLARGSLPGVHRQAHPQIHAHPRAFRQAIIMPAGGRLGNWRGSKLLIPWPCCWQGVLLAITAAGRYLAALPLLMKPRPRRLHPVRAGICRLHPAARLLPNRRPLSAAQPALYRLGLPWSASPTCWCCPASPYLSPTLDGAAVPRAIDLAVA